MYTKLNKNLLRYLYSQKFYYIEIESVLDGRKLINEYNKNIKCFQFWRRKISMDDVDACIDEKVLTYEDHPQSPPYDDTRLLFNAELCSNILERMRDDWFKKIPIILSIFSLLISFLALYKE